MHRILRQAGQARRHKHEQGQNPCALALLNQGAEYENPQGIVEDMRERKVDENGSEETPYFPVKNFRQAGLPAGVYAVNIAVAGDAEMIHLRQVCSEIGQNGDGETGDKQRERQPADFQPAGWEKDPERRSIPFRNWTAHALKKAFQNKNVKHHVK